MFARTTNQKPNEQPANAPNHQQAAQAKTARPNEHATRSNGTASAQAQKPSEHKPANRSDVAAFAKSAYRGEDGLPLARQHDCTPKTGWELVDCLTERKTLQSVLDKVRHVNDVNEGIPLKDQHNCVACAIAADKTLGGTPTKAENSNAQGDIEIRLREEYPYCPFRRMTGYQDIETLMTNSGPGARGIVLAGWPEESKKEGHVFNVVNVDGTVVFIDAQSGKEAHAEPFEKLFLVQTTYGSKPT
ncbi:MAG: toxin glutamine deamidase domain-containing protein [Polyangiaceae bacterium]|nr:toxin glutamine deamidase domain-containing protein [Polyangiaceae bacterium]